jgi:exonuclease III
MRVLCVNANNRLSAFLDEIQPGYDLLLVQEWARHATDDDWSPGLVKLPASNHRSVTKYLLAQAHPSSEVNGWRVLLEEERVQVLDVNGLVVCNVYLPASSSSARRDMLEQLRDEVLVKFPSISLVIGDFNLAPRAKDGWYGDEHSTWTKKYEQDAFASLCEQHGLVDLGAEQRWNATFKRMNRGKMTAFRCDLALAKPHEWAWVDYVHELRTEKKTDHSGLLVRRTLP